MVVAFEICRQGGLVATPYQTSARVAADPFFYLDDFGAHVGQRSGGYRTLLPNGEVQNSYPVQGLFHGTASLSVLSFSDRDSTRCQIRCQCFHHRCFTILEASRFGTSDLPLHSYSSLI